jgi:SAM-dependent methyltransferase
MGKAERDADAVAYYHRSAAALASSYDSVTFEDVHAKLLDYLPPAPSKVLDVGAGSGRDARALASRGHHVTAVEPAESLRRLGRVASPEVEWIDDRLPELKLLARCGRRYDFILCSAVLMSLPPSELEPSLAAMGALLEGSGRLALSLRDPLPHEQVLHRHSDSAVFAAAEEAGLRLVGTSRVADALGRSFEWRSYLYGREAGAGRGSRVPKR